MNVIDETLKLLGTHMKDVVTGEKGMVDSVSFDAYGCVQVSIRPAIKRDGTHPVCHWFDVKRMRPTKKGRIMPAADFSGIEFGKEQGPAEKPNKPA